MTTHSSAQGVRDNFDTGPLSWVMGEIREALTRSKAAIQDGLAQSAEAQSASLRQARISLHQAHGAIQVVDVDGVSLITGSIEDLLGRVDSGALDFNQSVADSISEAYQAVIEYLEELLSGARHQPVRLFPYYKALQELRGTERIHPSDLFFPNLAIRPQLPLATAPRPLDPVVLRQRFEKSLLPFLKSTDRQAELGNAHAMLAVIIEVERAQTVQQARAFWWVMRGFAETVAAGKLNTELYVKQLFAHINLQIRRLGEAEPALNERLLRDALFVIAGAESPSSAVQQIHVAYQLDGMVPYDYSKRRYGQLDLQALSRAKDRLTQAKILWNRIAGGDSAAADPFIQEMAGLAEAGAGLNAPSLTKLLRELNGIARHASRSNPGDSLGLEVAASLLFVENALSHSSRLSDDFAGRAEAMTARLLSIVAGKKPEQAAEWLDDMSRDAQQRETLAVLSTEMQTSLGQVEKLLDDYFGNPAKRASLEPIDTTLYQIEGALAILDQDDAVRAVRHTRAAVKHFAEAEPSFVPDPQELRHVAQNVGALSFFIETLQLHSDGGRKRFLFNETTGVFHANLIEKEDDAALDVVIEIEASAEPQPEETVVASVSASSINAATTATKSGAASGLTEKNTASAPSTTTSALVSAANLSSTSAPPAMAAPPVFVVAAEAQANSTLSLPEDSQHSISEPAAGVAATSLDSFPLPEIENVEGTSDTAPAPEALTAIELADLQIPENSATSTPAAKALSSFVTTPASSMVAPLQAVVVPASDEAVDAELLEIFLAEAEEVLECVAVTMPQLRNEPHNQEHLTTLRRSFHTLKGSGRMVGLMVFGDAAWSVEQVLNLKLSDGSGGNPALYSLIDTASEVLGAWVVDFKTRGSSDRMSGPLTAAAERVRNGEPFYYEDSAGLPENGESEAAMADNLQTATEAQASVAAELSFSQPETEQVVTFETSFEQPPENTIVPATGHGVGQGASDPFALEDLPPADLTFDTLTVAADEDITLDFSLLEVGEAPMSDADLAAFNLDRTLPATTDRTGAISESSDIAGQNTFSADETIRPDSPEIFESDPAVHFTIDLASPTEQTTGSKPALASGRVIEFPDVHQTEEKHDDNIKRIGTLEISVPLHNIYLAETDELVRLLANDIAEWRHEPERNVNIPAVHASHSLAGSSATVGFKPLQEIAYALEMVLQCLARNPVQLAEAEFDLIENTIDCLKGMLQKFALGEMPPAEPRQVTGLEQLLGDLTARARASSADTSERGLDINPYAELETPAPILASAEAQIDTTPAASDVQSAAEPTAAGPSAAAAAPDDPASSVAAQVQITATMSRPAVRFVVTEVRADAVAASAEPPPPSAAGKSPAPLVPDPQQLPISDSAPNSYSVSALATSAETPEHGPASLSENLPAQTTRASNVEVGRETPFYELERDYASTLPGDDLDKDLLPVFLEEGSDILPQMGNQLRAWQNAPADTAPSQSLLRLLHTIKGSARMAGAMGLGQHMHEMESRIEQIGRSGSVSREAIDELLGRLDVGLYLFEQLQNPDPNRKAPSFKAFVPASVPLPQSAGQHPASVNASTATPVAPGFAAARDPALPARLLMSDSRLPATAAPVPLVRVRADILDRLVNQAGEVSITRTRVETEVETLRQSMFELTENVSRLRSQLREIEIQAESQMASQMAHATDREFDPLEFDRFTRLQELTRMMAESVNDVATVQQNLVKTIDGATDGLNTQARLTRDLQQDLMRVRMVQFASISERLYRVTRQASKEVDKRVNLDIRGGSVEMDRSVLEKMAGPFEHLLRNAIVHGIESRAARIDAGKNETGELLVEIRQEGNEVVIQFSDDGGGLNLARIREKALDTGLLSSDAEISEPELKDLIFHSGFSTAKEVTELAGRGVGMDVVRSEAAALGGRISISSEAGKGACFTIQLPLTLAVTQVVVVSAGGKTFAVPSVLVEQVQQLKVNPLSVAYNDGAVYWQNARVPMYYLSALLGDQHATPVTQQYSPVVILKSGNERVAIHVDEVVGNREVVVKNIGPQLARMIGVAGATVLGSGDIVLILNPVPLALKAQLESIRAPRILASDAPADMGAIAEMARSAGATTGNLPLKSEPVQGLRSQSIVMVVDDSLTVRRVTQRFLTREGYQIVLAKDGVDALEQLQSITPDVMLVDIEMPRMDGFDLTRNVRSDERTRHIPIIMITSRTAEKHRKYAFELGVNKYLGKPYQETDLLRLVGGFISKDVAVSEDV